MMGMSRRDLSSDPSGHNDRHDYPGRRENDSEGGKDDRCPLEHTLRRVKRLAGLAELGYSGEHDDGKERVARVDRNVLPAVVEATDDLIRSECSKVGVGLHPDCIEDDARRRRHSPRVASTPDMPSNGSRPLTCTWTDPGRWVALPPPARSAAER